MPRYALLIALVALLFLAACSSCPTPATQAYHVNGQGQVSAATRSALDGSTEPGRQELVGVFLPFPGGLSFKVGLDYDGTQPPGYIELPNPWGPNATQSAIPQTVMVGQQVGVPVQTMTTMQSTDACGRVTTFQVPQNTIVPGTRQVPLPVPTRTYSAPRCP